jgi:hypothetical protein
MGDEHDLITTSNSEISTKNSDINSTLKNPDGFVSNANTNTNIIIEDTDFNAISGNIDLDIYKHLKKDLDVFKDNSDRSLHT